MVQNSVARFSGPQCIFHIVIYCVCVYHSRPLVGRRYTWLLCMVATVVPKQSLNAVINKYTTLCFHGKTVGDDLTLFLTLSLTLNRTVTLTLTLF